MSENEEENYDQRKNESKKTNSKKKKKSVAGNSGSNTRRTSIDMDDIKERNVSFQQTNDYNYYGNKNENFSMNENDYESRNENFSPKTKSNLGFDNYRGDNSNKPSRNLSKEKLFPSGRKATEMDAYDAQFDETSKGKGSFNVNIDDIDYVLVYKENDSINDQKYSCCDDREEEIEKELLRKRFIEILKTEGKLEVVGMPTVSQNDDQYTYVLIHAPFKTLCKQAEKSKLRMPVDMVADPVSTTCDCCAPFELFMTTEDEVDFFSEPFEIDNKESFKDYDEPSTFFRKSIRSLLTYNILVGLDAYIDDDDRYDYRLKMKGDDDEGKAHKHKKGLLYMMHKNIFTDSFVLHDKPTFWKDETEKDANDEESNPIKNKSVAKSERELLYEKWMKFCKFLPLWSIRNYFGEKIAFYFAWAGLLVTSLWLPMLFGLGVFSYGVYRSVVYGNNTISFTNVTLIGTTKQIATTGLSTMKEACDNDVTPYYALFICIWGTIFIEIWKRKNAALACEWDVDSYEEDEVDRPEFRGIDIKNPIDPEEKIAYYPLYKRCFRYMVSILVLFIMIAMVFLTTALVVLYRVYMQVTYCSTWSPIVCVLATTVCSSVMNAIVITILGVIYPKLAIIFTNFENHQKQSDYDDSLILKMFAFQFANCYTTCFYIAFFIQVQSDSDGLFGLGPQYHDVCDNNNCMSMLSFQILILMIIKPITKFATDVILPWGLQLLSKIWQKCCSKNSINPGKSMENLSAAERFLEQTRHSPDPGVFPHDCTLAEYMEKVLLYGYLMLFAASFPLAPLIALITIAIDLRVDGYRLLRMYRRSIALIAEDIGTWHTILDILNVIGVVSNAFLIAFTSRWGDRYDTTGKLWVVIGFEHIVFLVKIIAAYLIPDVPAWVTLQQEREKHYLAKNEKKRDKAKIAEARHSAKLDMMDSMARQRRRNQQDEDDVDASRDSRNKQNNKQGFAPERLTSAAASVPPSATPAPVSSISSPKRASLTAALVPSQALVSVSPLV